jgi:hypothetical protein
MCAWAKVLLKKPMPDKAISIVCLFIAFFGDIIPHAYIMFFVAPLLLSAPTIWSALRDLPYRHDADPEDEGAGEPADSIYAAVAAALMSDYEVADPTAVAARYRNETSRLQALKEALDAHTDAAQALIRHRKSVNR